MISERNIFLGKNWEVVHKLVANVIEFCVTTYPCSIKGKIDIGESLLSSDGEDIDRGPYEIRGLATKVGPSGSKTYL